MRGSLKERSARGSLGLPLDGWADYADRFTTEAAAAASLAAASGTGLDESAPPFLSIITILRARLFAGVLAILPATGNHYLARQRITTY